MSTVRYEVEGLTCEHCVRAVTEELLALDGVAEVGVDLAPGGTSALTVTGEPLPDTEAVRDALDEAGGYRLLPTAG